MTRWRRPGGVGGRNMNLVLEHLYLLGQPGFKLDHPAAGVEHMSGLAFVGCGGGHLGAFDVVGEQGVHRQHGGQRGLAIAAGP